LKAKQQVNRRRRGRHGPVHLQNGRPGRELHLAAAGIKVVMRPGCELHLATAVEVAWSGTFFSIYFIILNIPSKTN
jgi:hypothetical protein